MKLSSRAIQLLGTLTLATLLAHPAWADPPTRAGRVADVVGDAWVLDQDRQEWTHLERNQTLAQGDQVRTDPQARVSVRIGSTSLWLGENSDLQITQLDDGRALFQLGQGDLALRVRTPEAVHETTVQTREGAISPDSPGLLRVTQSNRGTQLGVLQGQARFASTRPGPVQRAWLRGGEQSEFWWADGFRVNQQPLTRDGFGDWLVAQDGMDAPPAAGSEPYVSPEMTGAEVLGQYGQWQQSPDYGAVWIPASVPPGWAPYRVGHWAWSRLWGWTWVDDAPWGFAPFHYGRWVMWRGRWSWAPGRFEVRPAYAPALVAWVGGPQVSVSIRIGTPAPSFGWYPLAPREVYVPGFQHSPAFARRFNPDPGPARRPPQSNLQVREAISYLPGQGAPARPMPSSTAQPVHVLPAPPARAEWSNALPTRTADESPQRRERQELPGRGETPWRSQAAQQPAAPPVNTVPTRTPPLPQTPAQTAQPRPAVTAPTPTPTPVPATPAPQATPHPAEQATARPTERPHEREQNAERSRNYPRDPVPAATQASSRNEVRPQVTQPPPAQRPTEQANPAPQERNPSAARPQRRNDDELPPNGRRDGKDRDRRDQDGGR